jgi:hypothetical protein
MSFAALALLGLALSAPPSGARPAAPRSAATATPCTRYRVIAEKNELAGEDDVAGWARGALERTSLLDERSLCYLHVRITAGATSAGGKVDGWVAHVAVSTRRYVKEGKLITNEKGTLLIEAKRDEVAAKARTFVEEFVAKELKGT